MSIPPDPATNPADECVAQLKLGNELAMAGDMESAIGHFRAAAAVNPHNSLVHDDLVYLLHFHPAYDDQDIFRELSIWERQHARELGREILPHRNNRDARRRLKIGYVSPEFCRQAESFFVMPLLQAHDHVQFEIHCYSRVEKPDDRTEEMKKCADVWHDVQRLDDAELAERIRADQIDILVDLTMHMRLSRMLTFARKPAPVQVAWLAYPGGTGLRTMDYRLTDRFLDPPDRPGWYTEESWRLPDCWVCYDPLSQSALATPRTGGAICFGSLNHPRKINDFNLRLWAKVLRRVDGSRMILHLIADSHRQRAARIFQEEGIPVDRLEFVGLQPRWEYLRTYDRIDIALDTLPYNGITTTCDALWMGTPVVSLLGRNTAGRAGLGILSTVGLPELVAGGVDRFIEIAVGLARDRSRLIDWRKNLRSRVEASPLMDAGRFARNVEAAYCGMWERWRQGRNSGSMEPIPAVALQHQGAGRWREAEAIYRGILNRQPENAEALHLLGLVARRTDRAPLAVEMITRAIAADGKKAAYHCTLGVILQNLGKIDEAIAEHLRAISLDPDFAEEYNNLGNTFRLRGELDQAVKAFRRAVELKPELTATYGNLGNALKEAGDVDGAIVVLRRAVELSPGAAAAHSNLGAALSEKGLLDDAIRSYRRAIEIDPKYALAHNNLGSALLQAGKSDVGIAAIRRAIEINPNLPIAHYNLGNALKDAGKSDQAIAAYRRAIELKPDYVEALQNLGNLLHSLGTFDEAVASLGRVVQLRPGYAEGYSDLGVALHDVGRMDEAIASFRRAIELLPRSAETHYNLANALKTIEQLDDAIAESREAIRLKPGFAEAHGSLGNALASDGQIEEAIASYREALRLKPELSIAHSNLAFMLHYHPSYSAEMILNEVRGWDERYAEPLKGLIQPHTNDRNPDRRLRIGYLSPDFRGHCQALFMIPLLSNHDRKAFEIFCYADVRQPDSATQRIRGYADAWRPIAGMADAEVAEKIREDRIDVLVDLTMHMSNCRPLVFARKPAPVQVAWLAYPGTTGLSAMDYRLTDPYLDPPGMNDSFYTEKSVRLPESFWCYDPLSSEHVVNALPAESAGFVTFGCLNNFCKVNEEVLKLWARVLKAMDRSRMMILWPEGSRREPLMESFRREGIEAQRIELVGRRPRRQYLEHYHRIDLGLDTFPYNGHTTSLDSYWMGVPVVTLVGRTVVGRAGLSQLSNLGLTELIAKTPGEYVEIAAQLAGDLPRLAQLRRTLRERMQKSPLMDAPRFARNIEAAYRWMWREWCNG